MWIKEFIGGLDTRRIPEATSGGVLTKANNGHITRGGEFEQRAAFVPTYTLPAGTIGMFYTRAGIVVFGSIAPPTMPAGVAYQRLQHSDGTTALVRVLSADLYAGKIYAVGEFADGAIFHFYDGTRVDDWFDGRARATFEVTGGVSNAAIPASGSFAITGGTVGIGNEITAVNVDGVDILGAPVAHTGDNSTTAADIAAQINTYVSVPNYVATSLGATVTITASTAGIAANGRVIAPVPDGDVTVGSIVNMSGGSNNATSQLVSLRINGVSILTGPIDWSTSNEATAGAIASAINSLISSPDYTASAVGRSVSIAAASSGTTANGYAVEFTLTNGFIATPSTLAMAGGSDTNGAQATGTLTVTAGAASNQMTALTVNGVSLISGVVVHTGDNATTAAAIATAINSHLSSPDYTASAVGAVVTIKTADNIASVNGNAINATFTGSFAATTTTMTGGVDDTFQPGTFVKTVGQKMYSVSGPNLHFSGIQAPTKWTTDTTGAGFVDLSSESSGSEELTALARYYNFLAIFAARVVQIWYVDPDPALNRQTQVLENTGTDCPRSVTVFGNSDLFYLDDSGLRSLRARDSSNAAATNDIGVPVDDVIVPKLESLTENERRQVVGLIEPRSGRFWLIMRDTAFVFSFFNGAKVSAWSTYDMSYQDSNDVAVPFSVDDAVVFNRRVHLRAGNTIYIYSGLAGNVFDATPAEAWTPYFDANKPSEEKEFTGIDIAMRGLWSVSAAMEPVYELAEDLISIEDETTYNSPTRSFQHRATHVSLRFRSQGVNPAGGGHRLGACVIHYVGSADSD